MREPVSQQLLSTPLPVDRVAARVTRKARPEHLWQPAVKEVASKAFSREVLATQPPPFAMKDEVLAEIFRLKRRDRLEVIGYSAKQPPTTSGQGAKWVVRCDCGNYEERTRILRWLRTEAPDMCVECRVRAAKKKERWVPDLPPAKRPFT